MLASNNKIILPTKDKVLMKFSKFVNSIESECKIKIHSSHNNFQKYVKIKIIIKIKSQWNLNLKNQKYSKRT
jgi:hypothetical protein